MPPPPIENHAWPGAGTDATRRRLSGLCNWLGSRWATGLWLLATGWVALLLWQAIIGWPLSRKVPVVFQAAPENAPDLWRARLHTQIPLLDWNAPWTRLWLESTSATEKSSARIELKRYPSLARLLATQAPGAWTKGHAILMRPPGNWAPFGQLRGLVAVSWITPAITCWASLALWTVATGLALWRRSLPSEALAGALRQIPIAAPLLLVALALAAALRFDGFCFPTWQPDTDDYLHPAAQIASGAPLMVTDRPLGYAFVIGWGMRLFGGLHGVVALQQTASLIGAAAIAGALWASASRLFFDGAARAISRALAVAGAMLWGWHEGILERDWDILPEALTTAYMGLQIWLLWRLTARASATWLALLEYAAFCAAGWMLFLTKPNWGFALGLLPLPWIVRAAWGDAAWCRRVEQGVAGLAILGVVSALAYSIIAHFPANTLASLEIRSRVLLCWHVPMVRREIDRQLAGSPSPQDRAIMEELAPAFDHEVELAKTLGPGPYPLLGYLPDRLYYHGLEAPHYWALSSADRTAFGQRLFFAALRHEPATYVRKVWRQLGVPLQRPYGPADFYLPAVEGHLADSEKFAARVDSYLPATFLQGYRSELRRARAAWEKPWPAPPLLALSLRVAWAYHWLAPAMKWAVGLPLLTLLAAALWKPWRRAVAWRVLTPPLTLALWATGSAAACALTSSVAQALEIQRYVDLFMPLTLLSELLWPLIALALFSALRHKQLAGLSAPACSLPAMKTSAAS